MDRRAFLALVSTAPIAAMAPWRPMPLVRAGERIGIDYTETPGLMWRADAFEKAIAGLERAQLQKMVNRYASEEAERGYFTIRLQKPQAYSITSS